MDSNHILTKVSESKCFDGIQLIYTHSSISTKCVMKFSIFLPPKATNFVENSRQLPLVYYLGGLGTDVHHLTNETGFQRFASDLNLIVVGPDTSPRGLDISSDCMYAGEGASLYINATEPKWRENYQMFTYITEELPTVIKVNFPVVDTQRAGIMGHSMGGHGALVAALKRPNLYRSVSALAPASNPGDPTRSACSGFVEYLGTEQSVWKDWNSSVLVQTYDGKHFEILVDQGTLDRHHNALQVWSLVKNSFRNKNLTINVRMRAGYDHGNLFISSFIGDHLKHHARILYGID